MKDKVVVITGGTSGIGRALAFEYGHRGYRVAITGRKLDALQQTASDLEQAGIETLAIQADAAKEEDNRRMAEQVLERFGRIDTLINNAGISMRAAFADLDPEVIRRVMDINFYGTVYATKYCLPSIRAHKGCIIGISSIAGFRALPGRTGYAASKAAMQSFLETLRAELTHEDVHVMIACPGFTASNIRNTALAKDGSAQGETPRDEAKMMSAEECAARIFQAQQRKRHYEIMTAQGKLAVWLNKFFPVLLDKAVYRMMAAEPGSPFPMR